MLDTDEQAFLNAINAAPEDEAPRLIFADWLEERDDIRGVWVRDRELFAWMGPQAENPCAKMRAAWEEAIASLEYVPREQHEERLQHIAKLGELLGRLGETMVPYALAQFENPKHLPHLDAFLFSIAGHLRNHTKPLLDAAKSSADERQDLALRTLIAGGRSSPEMLQHVLDIAANVEAVRFAAFDALQQTQAPYRGPMVAYLCEIIANATANDELQEPELLVEYVRVVGRDVGERSDVLTVLTQLLSSRSMLLVEEASQQLHQVREHVLPLLGKAIRDSRPEALPALFRYVREAVPEWGNYLTAQCLAPGAKLPVLKAAFEQFAECDDTQALRMESLFRRMLQHPQTKVRLAVVEAMERDYEHRETHLKLMEEAWDGQHVDVKYQIIYAVRNLTGLSKEGLPLIMRGITDHEDTIRHETASVVVSADQQELITERLKRRTNHEDEQVRASAYLGLSDFIPWDESLIDVVHKGLRDDSPKVRRAVWHGVEGHIKVTDSYIKLLRSGLRDRHASVVQAACVTAYSVGMAEKLRHELLDLARDDSPRVRAGALLALVEQAGDESVRKLYLRGFRDEERVVEAILMGFERSYTRDQFLPEIAQLAKHENPALRERVQRILRQGADWDNLTPDLEAAFRRGLADVNELVVKEALTTVMLNPEKMKFALSEVLRVLDVDWPNMDCSSEVSSALGYMPDAADELVKRVNHPRERVRYVAYTTLQTLLERKPALADTLGPTLVPLLQAQLPKEFSENLRAALQLVGRLGEAADACLPFLQQAIERPYFEARDDALEAIGGLGPKAVSAKHSLLRTYERERYTAGVHARRGLIRLAAFDPDLLPVVQTMLTNASSDERFNILIALRETPTTARLVVPELMHLLETPPPDSNPDYVLNALGVTGAACVPFLPRVAAVLRKTDDDYAATHIIRLYGELGEHAAGASDVLCDFATNGTTAVRTAIASALGSIPSPERIGILELLINDLERGPRVTAGSTMMQLENVPTSAIPAVCKALLNPKWDGNLNAKGETIDHEADEVLFNNMGIDCRTFLATVLQNMGAAAAPALPSLAKMVNEKNEHLFRTVCWVLGNIGDTALPTLRTFAKSATTASLRATAQASLDEVLAKQKA